MRLWSLKRKSSESWVGKRRCIVSVEKYVKNILSKSRRTKSWKVERFHFVSFWISKSQKSWTVERFYFQCRKVEKLYKWKVPKGRATGIFIILSRNNLSLCYIWSCWVKFQPLIDEILTQNGSRSLGHPLWHSRESLKKVKDICHVRQLLGISMIVQIMCVVSILLVGEIRIFFPSKFISGDI